MNLRLLTCLPAGALLFLSLGTPASAKFPYVALWQSIYPNSLSDDNVFNGTGTACALCHADPTGGDPWNAYGWKLYELMQAGANIGDAITQAEPFDSDADPSGSTNLEEIMADTQPGWTVGSNNTIYHKDGTTDTNQPPAPGILGDLDPPTPCPDLVYCDTNPVNVADLTIDTCDTTAGSINLLLTGAPANQFGYAIIGAGNGVSTDPPGAQGDLCLIGASIGRYAKDASFTDGTGSNSWDIWNSISGGGGGGIPKPPGGTLAPGQTWNFQAWHRDGMGPSKFSKAIQVTFR